MKRHTTESGKQQQTKFVSTRHGLSYVGNKCNQFGKDWITKKVGFQF